ncbi:MAG: LamG-like jellyroll fold domain-containing protein [Planctomycetota bacterium]
MTSRSKRKQRRQPRGAAMLLVLIAVAMCTILALSFLAAQEPTALVASNIDRKTQARQIAESALKMAIDYVNEDADWRTDKSSGQWMSNISLDGGTFTLSGTDEADGDLADDTSEAVLLTVVASYQGVTHRVSARVTPGAEETTANRLLLVAGSGSSPSSQDLARKTFFESLGYVVTVIDDSDSQATYDAAVAVNDVVYVSEETSSSSVNTKLRDVSIGVLNDEGYLYDDFGFSTSPGSSHNDVTAIDLTDNSHPITSGLSLGSLSLVSSGDFDNWYATSAIASGVTVLADHSGSATDPVLMVADVGDSLHYGTAAGRRVMMPATDDLDFANLSTDGQTLYRQAIAWAADGSTTPSGDTPTLLALYEFNQQAVATPTLVGHWLLDETASSGEGGISAKDDIDVHDSARIDSYNSSLGTYASQTPGTNAVVTTNSTSSNKFDVESSGYVGGDGYIGVGGSTSSVFRVNGTLTGSELALSEEILINSMGAPTGLGSSEGNFSRSSGSTVISSDRTFTDMTLTSSATVTISGDVTIWVQDDFLMSGSSQLLVPDGSSLSIYVADNVDLNDSSQLNPDTSGTDRVTMYAYGEQNVDLTGSAIMSGTLYTDDDLDMNDSTHFYGRVLAEEDIQLEGSAEIHHDTALGGFPTAGASATFGNTSSSGSSYDTVENDQAATQFTLTEAMTVTSMSAYLWGADDGGDVRFAIYEDSSGSPGALIAESNRESLREESWGWETEVIGPVDLSPGTYWLALSLEGDDGTARYRYQSGGTTRHNTNNGVDNGFNDPWGASSSTLSHTIAIYASGTTSGGGALTVAADASVTDNSGTYQGDPTGGAAGIGDGGTAVTFDGDGDYLEVPHDSSYLLNQGTVSLHAYPTALSGWQGLFSKDSMGNDTGGHLRILADGTSLQVRMQTTSDDPYRTGSSIEIQSASGVLSDNTWYHIAVTWGDGQLRAYVDGALVASANHLGGLGTSSGGVGNAEPIVFGAMNDTSGDLVATPIRHEFTGRIDDVRIYDLPLDAAQATNLAGGSDPGSRAAPGYVIADTSGYGAAADMVVYDTTAISWPGSGGLQFTGDTIATTQDYATKLHDAIEANEEFAVEVLLTRAAPGTTSSPSHVVGYADGATAHNFLLGQDSAKAEARVRDSSTGTTGVLSPELLSSSDLASSGDTHIVLSYASGTVSIYIDGSLDSTGSAGGTLNNWDNDHFLVFGGSYTDANHWRGTLKRVAIYDESFNAIQANNVYNGNDPGTGESGAGGAGSVEWDEVD